MQQRGGVGGGAGHDRQLGDVGAQLPHAAQAAGHGPGVGGFVKVVAAEHHRHAGGVGGVPQGAGRLLPGGKLHIQQVRRAGAADRPAQRGVLFRREGRQAALPGGADGGQQRFAGADLVPGFQQDGGKGLLLQRGEGVQAELHQIPGPGGGGKRGQVAGHDRNNDPELPRRDLAGGQQRDAAHSDCRHCGSSQNNIFFIIPTAGSQCKRNRRRGRPGDGNFPFFGGPMPAKIAKESARL